MHGNTETIEATYKPYHQMDDLDRIIYLADDLDDYQPCPYPRKELLSFVAAYLVQIEPGSTGTDLDIAYEDWLMKKAIEENTLEALVSTQAAREFQGRRVGEGWALFVRLGASWAAVRSRREPVRVWRSPTALIRFCEKAGIKNLNLEL